MSPPFGIRVTRIDDKVHDHLFQLPLVGANGRQCGVVAQPERDLFPDQTIEQMGQVRERLAQIDQLRAQCLFARIGQKLADQGGRTIRVLIDLHEIGVVQIALIVTQQQQVAMARDRREEIVEIMRHAPCKLSDRLHFLALNELRLERFQFRGVVHDRDEDAFAGFHRAVECDLNENLAIIAAHAQEFGMDGAAP